MNGVEWMLTQLDKKEFEQPESDPAAWEEAQAAHSQAVRDLKLFCRRPVTHRDRARDPDAD